MSRLSRTIGVPIASFALLAIGLAACGSVPVTDPDVGKPKLRGERELLAGNVDPDEMESERRHVVPLGPFKPVTIAAAPGWAGQSVMDQTKDDWEPATAFDPNGSYG